MIIDYYETSNIVKILVDIIANTNSTEFYI